jgi:hypothetical protein
MLGSAVLLVALVFAALFMVFPQMVHTGDAQLQVWLGPSGAQWGYLALAIVLGGVYVWAAVRGTREREHAEAWLPGTAAGLLCGAATLVLYVGAGLFATTPGGLTVPLIALLALILVGGLLVGVAAGRARGAISAGAVAGFWLAAVLAMVSGPGLVARDLVLSDRLVRTAWVGDRVQDALCNGVHGATLVGCEVGDDLGWLATSLLILPLLGLLIGALGGAAARLSVAPAQVQRTTWGTTISTPLACGGFLLALMIVESLTKIW